MKMINTIEKQHNYNMIDLCKFIGAYIIIAYHSNPVVDCPDSIFATLLQYMTDIMVPFYFVATGFFLYIRVKDEKIEKINKINIYTKKIFKMYLIATLISLPLTIYGYVTSGNGIISCILSYIKYFFFVGKLYNSYHLWYLLSVIYSLIIMSIMIRKNAKEEHVFVLAFVIYTFFEVMWYAMLNIDSFSGIAYKTINLYKYVFNNGTILCGFIYIAIGVLIAKYKKYINTWVCFVGVILIYVLNPYLPMPVNDYLRLIAVTFLFKGMLGIHLKNRSCYPFMRKMSMMIYLSHLIFLSIYTFLIIKEPNKYGVDTFIVTSVACTVFAYVYAIDIKGIVKKIMCRNGD